MDISEPIDALEQIEGKQHVDEAACDQQVLVFVASMSCNETGHVGAGVMTAVR